MFRENMRRLIVLPLLLFVGCQMDHRFARLQTGMTKAEVMSIVAKRPSGDTTQDGVETVHWEAGSHYAKFKNGRLTDFGSD